MTQHSGRGPGAWCAGLLLAGVSVVVGCRVADTDGITPVPQLLAFLPWLLAPAGFALLCALLARWWPGLVWGVAVLGLLAWYLEPYGKTAEPGGPPLGPLVWIMPGSRALAPRLAALSSVAMAPPWRPPPPCDARHQTPLPDPA